GGPGAHSRRARPGARGVAAPWRRGGAPRRSRPTGCGACKHATKPHLEPGGEAPARSRPARPGRPEVAPGVSSVCQPACRWLARIVSFGPDSHGDVFSRRCGESLVQALRFVPVGYVPRPDGTLSHREGGRLVAQDVVGWIEQAWAGGDGVDGIIHLCDEAIEIRRILLAAERARPRMWGCVAVSIAARAGDFEIREDATRVVHSVQSVQSVDFVSVPAGRGCYVRKRLPCSGVVIRDGVPVAG